MVTGSTQRSNDRNLGKRTGSACRHSARERTMLVMAAMIDMKETSTQTTRSVVQNVKRSRMRHGLSEVTP
jgi:hypothetical protein